MTAKRKASENEASGNSSEKLDVLFGILSQEKSQEDLKFARDSNNLNSRARESIRWYDNFEFANKYQISISGSSSCNESNQLSNNSNSSTSFKIPDHTPLRKGSRMYSNNDLTSPTKDKDKLQLDDDFINLNSISTNGYFESGGGQEYIFGLVRMTQSNYILQIIRTEWMQLCYTVL